MANHSAFSKEGTATGSAVAIGTSVIKYDSWLVANTHASQDLIITIKGSAAITIAAGDEYSFNVRCAPTQVTVNTNNTTYRISAEGL